MDRSPRRTPDGPPEPDFPGEEEWLGLEPPEVRPDFVAATLRLVVAGAAPVEDDADLDERILPPDTLRQFGPPTPSPSFVSRTLQAMRIDQQVRWRALLVRHVVPEPSPDFVARTLAALRVPTRSRWRWPAVRVAVTGLVAAAAILLAFAIWADRGPRSLDRAIAETMPELRASTWAPSALPVLLLEVRTVSEPLDLPATAVDGAFTVLRAHGARGAGAGRSGAGRTVR